MRAVKTQRGEKVCVAGKGIFETRLALPIPLVSKLLDWTKDTPLIQGSAVKWFPGQSLFWQTSEYLISSFLGLFGLGEVDVRYWQNSPIPCTTLHPLFPPPCPLLELLKSRKVTRIQNSRFLCLRHWQGGGGRRGHDIVGPGKGSPVPSPLRQT